MPVTFVDLSHSIEEGMETYKNLPGPIICDYWTREHSRDFYEDGSSFQIGKIEMVANTGTYLDSPFHRYAEGKDLSELILDTLANLDGILISVDGLKIRAIDATYFQGLDLEGKAVLIHTGWDQFWRTEPYFSNHPFLSQDAAEFLRDAKVKLVGIDSYNIDDTSVKARPVHSILLGAEILIVEHLCNLSALVDKNFSFYAVPPKIKSFGTFPVRAFAKISTKSF